MTAVSATPAATSRRPNRHEVEQAIRAIPDPEIPVISIDDLGIVREVRFSDDNSGVEDAAAGAQVEVIITPTYSGCPAMAAITDDVRRTARRYGLTASVETRLHPAWTTDWMSEQGRESLRRFGIAPPGSRSGEPRGPGPVFVGLSTRQVDCPQCGSVDTQEISRFGSTACKALRRCRSCAEPFEEFKTI